MGTFISTQSQRIQQHFEVLEIDLPVIEGDCTLGDGKGFGTPLSCDQNWVESGANYKTYYFTNINAPMLPSSNGEPIHRCIIKIGETSAELKPESGLAARASLSVTLQDFTGKDPNKEAPGVTDAVINQGTYLGKLAARQIFEGREARLKLYRVEAGGGVDLVNGAQTRHFTTDTLSLNSKDGTWTAKFKDVMSVLNLNEKEFPVNDGGFLKDDCDSTTLEIPVDSGTDYESIFSEYDGDQFSKRTEPVLRIGDEFFRVNIYATDTNYGVKTVASDKFIVVHSRTTRIIRSWDSVGGANAGRFITRYINDEHKAGDEVFICYVSDDEPVHSLLKNVLLGAGVSSSYIPYADWTTEVNEWHPTAVINTIHSEPKGVNSVIKELLTSFLMDMWTDNTVTPPQARLSAVTVHKQSTATLNEGREINAGTIKKAGQPSLRATSALVRYGVPYLADDEKFTSASVYAENELITQGLFGKHKDKRFPDTPLLNRDEADLLVQRWVGRYKFMPFLRTFITEERFMNFKLGEVVEMESTIDQNFDGTVNSNVRGQVTKITPRYNSGRSYNVNVLTYESPTNVRILTNNISELNLYLLFGAPGSGAGSQTYTVILDGAQNGYSYGETAIRVGLFPSNSVVNILLVNDYYCSANGGTGGAAHLGDGGAGGTVIDCSNPNEATVNIYLAGDITSIPGHGYTNASGKILAPGGGGGGSSVAEINDGSGGIEFRNPSGGGGGAGIIAGKGGISNVAGGIPGHDGDRTFGGPGGFSVFLQDGGAGGDLGQSGSPGTNPNFGEGVGSGGPAGKGIVDGEANVTVYGIDQGVNYINGGGDHPNGST